MAFLSNPLISQSLDTLNQAYTKSLPSQGLQTFSFLSFDMTGSSSSIDSQLKLHLLRGLSTAGHLKIGSLDFSLFKTQLLLRKDLETPFVFFITLSQPGFYFISLSTCLSPRQELELVVRICSS